MAEILIGITVIMLGLSRVTLAQYPLAKRVEIDKTTQTLRAFENERLVLVTRVSTGRWDGATPNGNYQAGQKDRMHYSHKYHNAPMPYSVQVTGNIFIHGYAVVPNRPASHGCIRLPLDGKNPARQFYEWVEPGTAIRISGKWLSHHE